MVFLLVVKDRGSALRFEPHRFPEEECGEDDDRVGFRMLYEVDGTEYELVPPPHCLMDLISLDLEALAGLDQPKALIANALRRLASKIDGEAPVPREGGFVARLGEIDLNIEVCVFSTELGESYHLQFPLVSEQASDVAQQELVGVCEPSEDRLDSGSRELDPPGRT
jgi:hypothetical protein